MLSRQFNVMLSRIESLMEQVKKEQSKAGGGIEGGHASHQPAFSV